MYKIYLAGKITGEERYREKFGKAAGELRRQGYAVMNPGALPNGFEYRDYMKVCTAMMDVCEVVCFLPDWKDSFGAKYEYGHAIATGKSIAFFTENGTIQFPDEPEDEE